MKLLRWSLLAGLLAVPVAWGQDPPKDDKKPPTARERYAALVKEFSSERSKIIAAYQKASEAEQAKLLEKYRDVGKDYAEKFLKLSEDEPKDPAALDALFWILQNASDSPVAKKAEATITTRVGELPLKDLVTRVRMIRSAQPAFLEAVLKRAEKDEADTQAGDLLAWIAMSGSEHPSVKAALDRLLDKYPDHTAIQNVTQRLSFGDSPNAEATLKRILEKASKPGVQAAAAISLGKVLSARTDRLGDKLAEADKVAAEAEKFLNQAIELAGKDKSTETMQEQAKKELKALRTLRVGKTVPEIAAGDLDDKEFKLSDYRGKVVLLDFWGHW